MVKNYINILFINILKKNEQWISKWKNVEKKGDFYLEEVGESLVIFFLKRTKKLFKSCYVFMKKKWTGEKIFGFCRKIVDKMFANKKIFYLCPV